MNKTKDDEFAKSDPERCFSSLPNLHQSIRFQEAGNTKLVYGKVLNKNKKNSKHKNVVNIRLEDGSVKSFDFVKDIIDWKDASVSDDNVDDQTDVCCLHSLVE